MAAAIALVGALIALIGAASSIYSQYQAKKIRLQAETIDERKLNKDEFTEIIQQWREYALNVQSRLNACELREIEWENKFKALEARVQNDGS